MEKTFGKRIAELRHSKGMKQDELAGILNVSAQAVSKWENDQSYPDISLLPTISKIFGVSVDELLTGEKQEPAVTIVPQEQRKDLSEMTLRIVVTSSDNDLVKVNIPMLLVKSALEIGLELPQISSNPSLKNIDLQHIMELVSMGIVGNLVEVESSDGDTVRIFVD